MGGDAKSWLGLEPMIARRPSGLPASRLPSGLAGWSPGARCREPGDDPRARASLPGAWTLEPGPDTSVAAPARSALPWQTLTSAGAAIAGPPPGNGASRPPASDTLVDPDAAKLAVDAPTGTDPARVDPNLPRRAGAGEPSGGKR